MSRKGISPILAAVLLFAVTVSVVGIFANFAPNLVTSLTSGTQQQAEGRIQCEGAGISFEGVNYDSSAPSVTSNIRNTGETNLTNITVAVFNDQNVVINQSQDITVSTTGITDETLATDGQGVSDNTPDYVQAFSGQCGSIEVRQEVVT